MISPKSVLSETVGPLGILRSVKGGFSLPYTVRIY